MVRVHHGRLRFLVVCIVSVAALFISRLYYVQVISHDAFTAKATKQYFRTNAVSLDRGSIYFLAADGTRSSAATLQTGGTLAINPRMLEDAAGVYAKLSTITPIDSATFFERAAKKDDPYEEVAKRIPAAVVKKIAALNIPGVETPLDQWRLYPQGAIAAHVLGFVGYKGDTQVGRYGIEEQFETTLSRTTTGVYKNFFAELFLSLSRAAKPSLVEAGNIVTTIEPTVQAALEKELANIDRQWGSRITGGIIMDPHTGEIIALAATPSFDPNNFNTEKDVGVFSNPLVEDVYEMGSIIKPLTMAAGIDAGVITRTTTYNDLGTLTFNNKTIYNFDKQGRGVVTMQTVLNKSLNTGVAYVVSRLGNTRFANYMRSFGFGEKTNIDLPNEGTGLIKNLESNRDIEFVTASYGQGIALTPIATTRALAALANNGQLVQPHVVKTIEYTSGFAQPFTATPGRQVVSPNTARTVSAMLVEVVDDALLDGKYKQPHHTIAAKTGTAQLNKEGGGYYDNKYLHSFFGYFPAYDSKYIIFLFTVDPQGVTYASHTLTDPFMNLAKYLITYYNIPPDR